ncbi:hypothetical protein [Moraxella lacunata]|uniref:hypothetical protein n=1 Tax=Moraxella lacunata TaxID=477 RepID=UPI003EE2BD75
MRAWRSNSRILSDGVFAPCICKLAIKSASSWLMRTLIGTRLLLGVFGIQTPVFILYSFAYEYNLSWTVCQVVLRKIVI